MKLSKRWLSDYIRIDTTPEEYSAKMTMSGSKVEFFEIEGSEIKNVVTGKILEISKHQNADTLSVCKVDVSKETIQIVTGATNISVGDIVPVALDGAKIAGGKEIKSGELRGEKSEGMLCSVTELSLSPTDFPPNDGEGIMILDAETELGIDIKEAIGFNDCVFDFEITPNRPDCLSVLGLARESAVTYSLPYNEPSIEVPMGDGDINEMLKVSVLNTEKCRRYVARAVTDVTVAPSPLWLRERLRASGVRPINNIVDITNYVMLLYGQPMHAFDLRYVSGGEIIVRDSKEGEEIETLDGVVRALDPSVLAICDAKGPVAIAGVMGGELSGVMEDSKTIIFESANFDGPSVRRASKTVGIRTESSSRFEKGLDPHLCRKAADHALALVLELGCGKAVGGVIDIYDTLQKMPTIEFDHNYINRFLGTELPRDYMIDILKALDFEILENAVVPPTIRTDVLSKYDIAEEIARFFGYDKIPSGDVSSIVRGGLSARQKFERDIEELLLGEGFYEIVTFSFISPKIYDKLLIAENSPVRDSVVITNPLGEDTSIMRSTTVGSMVGTIAKNQSYRNKEAFFYEIGHEYIKKGDGELPDENPILTIGGYSKDSDFFFYKGVAERIFELLRINDVKFVSNDTISYLHPARAASIILRNETIGEIGEIHPTVGNNFDLTSPCYILKLSLDALYNRYNSKIVYTPVPRFPSTTRDLALVADDATTNGEIIDTIKKAAGALCREVSLFDVFRGGSLGEGKKSLAYSLVIRDDDKTITDDVADKIVSDVLLALEKIGVILRS